MGMNLDSIFGNHALDDLRRKLRDLEDEEQAAFCDRLIAFARKEGCLTLKDSEKEDE